MQLVKNGAQLLLQLLRLLVAPESQGFCLLQQLRDFFKGQVLDLLVKNGFLNEVNEELNYFLVEVAWGILNY